VICNTPITSSIFPSHTLLCSFDYCSYCAIRPLFHNRYYNLQTALSHNYVFFPFYSLLNVIFLICHILLLWQTHLMGVNIGFSLMILHMEKENTLRCADLLIFNNNSIAHDKFILIFLKEHSKATTYIN
jgi:hypothetical protein